MLYYDFKTKVLSGGFWKPFLYYTNVFKNKLFFQKHLTFGDCAV